MTDITELAQSLKAAAENAVGAHERLAAYPYGEIIDISQHEGEQIDIDITDLNEFNKEANPVNILALVEALEKAQAQSSKWLEAYHKAVSIGARYEERIAELESRTVTVKLPELCVGVVQSGHAVMVPYAGGHWFNKTAILEMLTAAGIKWEAE
ncbi:ead/Ea22-like family protein [Raoultella planticola]|uniref:ead/Ea22-like family protein n=1 Tax=Raoultella planticola TaxID=575 RepID=UPI00195474F3|nr:ead/Ea22-like family protein [Raoultella planticola]